MWLSSSDHQRESGFTFLLKMNESVILFYWYWNVQVPTSSQIKLLTQMAWKQSRWWVRISLSVSSTIRLQRQWETGMSHPFLTALQNQFYDILQLLCHSSQCNTFPFSPELEPDSMGWQNLCTQTHRPTLTLSQQAEHSGSLCWTCHTCFLPWKAKKSDPVLVIWISNIRKTSALPILETSSKHNLACSQQIGWACEKMSSWKVSNLSIGFWHQNE